MLLQPFLAEPVVDPSRLLISKSFVRRVDLGEPLGRRGLLLLAARDLVRVVLEGQLAVGALDLAVVGASRDAEDVVEVFAVERAKRGRERKRREREKEMREEVEKRAGRSSERSCFRSAIEKSFLASNSPSSLRAIAASNQQSTHPAATRDDNRARTRTMRAARAASERRPRREGSTAERRGIEKKKNDLRKRRSSSVDAFPKTESASSLGRETERSL